jgi:hypothetical protein
MAGIALGRRVAAAARGFLLEPVSGAPAADSVANRTESEDGGRPDPAPPVILATALAGSGGAMSVAAAVGVAVAAEAGGCAVLAVDLDPPSGGRGPTMLASESARELEDELRAAGRPFASAAARGNLCYLPLPSELDRVAELLDRSVAAAAVVVNVPPDHLARVARARQHTTTADDPLPRSSKRFGSGPFAAQTVPQGTSGYDRAVTPILIPAGRNPTPGSGPACFRRGP